MEIIVAPPHSIIFINDPTIDFDVPENIGPGLVWATENCVAVGTLAEDDGATTIQLVSDVVSPQGDVAFDGTIKTPGRVVAITTSDSEQLMSISSGEETRITVWVNDSREPDIILIRAR